MTLFRSPTRDRSRFAPTADWIWGGLGLSIASASATFAAYMIATAPAEVTGSGSKDWNVFVHWDHRAPATADTMPAPFRAASVPLQAAGIDPEPTGSINPSPIPATAPVPVIEPRTAQAGDLHGFILRNVVGDRALIEHRKTLSLVKPGSTLDEAGKVLAIERRGDSWVVKTAAGTIGDGS